MGQEPKKYHISDEGKVYKINDDGSFTYIYDVTDSDKVNPEESDYFSYSVISVMRAVIIYVCSFIVSAYSIIHFFWISHEPLHSIFSIALSVGMLIYCLWLRFRIQKQLQEKFDKDPFAVPYDETLFPFQPFLLTIGLFGFGSSITGSFRRCKMYGETTVVKYHWKWTFLPTGPIGAYRVMPNKGNNLIAEEDQKDDEVACVWLIFATIWPAVALLVEILTCALLFH